MPDPAAIDPDEIIPPGQPDRSRTAGAPGGAPPDLRGLLSSFIAKWLDDLTHIPGTGIRIGLDPLLALIPGLGDAASTTAGAAILLAAVRHRAPIRILGRMSANMVVNAVLNLIPFAGPAVSVWFRSNSRNNALLQDHLAGVPPGPPSAQSRILFFAVIAFVIALFAMSIFVWVAVWRMLGRLIG